MSAIIPPMLATFSPMDMGIIFLVILIFFGAKKLPEFARSMGQAVREFSKAKDDFEREMTRPPEPETPRPMLESTANHPEHPDHPEDGAHMGEAQVVETHPVSGTEPQSTVPKV